jgi:hypothetical protein
MSIANSESIQNPAQTTLTSKGDILSHNGTSPVRVAVGSNGFAITANTSTAYIGGMLWTTAPSTPSVGFEPISYTSNTADVTSVTFSSIPGTYKMLHFVVVGMNTITSETNTSYDNNMFIRINSDSAASYKHWYTAVANNTRLTVNSGASAQTQINNLQGLGYGFRSATIGFTRGYIPQYADTTRWKCGYAKSYASRGDSTTQGEIMGENQFVWQSNSAITSITFFAGNSAGTRTFKIGCQFYLYGTK